ncbi:MAG: type III pantothenate kinase [Crocinitomicaceae bacterium]|jgi:type III pantothenate kinase|tara:strand:+ start:17088 stop:17810 length:723 start_codon:yes stop_codon:yes gene_type:complete
MLEAKKSYLIVDAGNTSIKVALVENQEMGIVHRVKTWGEALEFVKGRHVVLASVLGTEDRSSLKLNVASVHQVTSKSRLPFRSLYTSMDTVGIDRLCNVAAAKLHSSGKNNLIIDIGTCVKFDFLSADGFYHGGSIAPGIDMRYRSLNHYTSKLPLLTFKDKVSLIGENTNASIHSGVINGMTHEIQGMISRYERDFDELQIFLTGGDASYFDFPQKSNIFANKNLTLEGIVEIYKIHAL